MMPAMQLLEEAEKPGMILRIGIRKSQGGIFWYNRCARMLESAPEEAMEKIRVSFPPFFPQPVTLSHFRQFLPQVGFNGGMKVVLVIGDEVNPHGSASALRRQKVWQRSLAVARISEFIALWLGGLISPEEAYQAGLLHDCATAVLNDEVLTHHAAAGDLMAHVWQQSSSVCKAIRFHHQSANEILTEMEEPNIWMVLRLATCLYDVLADQQSGLITGKNDGIINPLSSVDILGKLGLRQRDLRDIMQDVRSFVQPQNRNIEN